MRLTPRRAFTLTELLVVIGIVALVVSIVIPIIARMRQSAGGPRCSSGLRQIGQGIQMYANENGGDFPRAVFDGVGGPPTEYTAPLAAHPFQLGRPGANDVTAALFLLVRTQDLTPEVFICPSVRDAEPWDFGGGGRTAGEASNFPGRQFLTYSYANPYPSAAAEKAGYRLSYTLTSDFAIAADMNGGGPGVISVMPQSPRAAITAANSPNHAGDGQNVLYADGHIEFHDTPFCGMQRKDDGAGQPYRDNIYTFGAGGASGIGVRGAPVDPLDSVLLPTVLDGPAPSRADSPAAKASMPWLWGGMAACFAGAVLVVALLRRRASRRTTEPGAELVRVTPG